MKLNRVASCCENDYIICYQEQCLRLLKIEKIPYYIIQQGAGCDGR